MFDKSEKSDLLAEKFQLWHSKVHENRPVIRFFGEILPA